MERVSTRLLDEYQQAAASNFRASADAIQHGIEDGRELRAPSRLTPIRLNGAIIITAPSLPQFLREHPISDQALPPRAR